jgi:DNA-binding transcriptional LysR family regulator
MVDDDLAAIESRHLRYFLAVFQELHFGRAAAGLHIAEPALSRAIRKLETALGVRLFHRTSRAVTPTDAGRALSEGATKVLTRLAVAVDEARTSGASTTVRIGCSPYVRIERVLKFLLALQERMPEVPMRLIHLSSAEQLRRLRSGTLDFGIFDFADGSQDVDIEPLFAGEQLVALLPLGHRLAAKPVLGRNDLQREVLATFPRAANPALHERLLLLLEGAGYRFAGVKKADGPHTRDLVLAVAGGLGVAIVPSSLAEAAGSRAIVTHRPLDQHLTMPDTVVGWLANPPRYLSEVLAAIREIAPELLASSGDRTKTIGRVRS